MWRAYFCRELRPILFPLRPCERRVDLTCVPGDRSVQKVNQSLRVGLAVVTVGVDVVVVVVMVVDWAGGPVHPREMR